MEEYKNIPRRSLSRSSCNNHMYVGQVKSHAFVRVVEQEEKINTNY